MLTLVRRKGKNGLPELQNGHTTAPCAKPRQVGNKKPEGYGTNGFISSKWHKNRDDYEKCDTIQVVDTNTNSSIVRRKKKQVRPMSYAGPSGVSTAEGFYEATNLAEKISALTRNVSVLEARILKLRRAQAEKRKSVDFAISCLEPDPQFYLVDEQNSLDSSMEDQECNEFWQVMTE